MTPNDQAFEVHITLADVTDRQFSVNATAGTFTLSFNDGSTTVTTTRLTVGSGGSVL